MTRPADGRPAKREINSRDVAAAAGVAQSTVSRVLSGHPIVRPETRDRVLAAAKELGYVRSAAARSLRGGRTDLVGLLVSNITDAYVPALIESVSTTAFDRGYTVIIGSVQERAELQSAYLHMLMERRVEGAILTSGLIGSAPEIRPLMDRGLRVVLANREIDGVEADAVVFDNVAASQLATAHLVEHGRSRIAFVGGRPDAATTRDRLTGYRRALRKAGLAHDAALEVTGSYTSAFGYESATRLLRARKPPDAIVAADDTVAIGCLDALTDQGLRPGIDVSVIGFGDQPIASIRSVALTTIEASAAQTGEVAATVLIDRAEGLLEGPPRRTVLPHALIVRSSCGPHPAAHPDGRDRNRPAAEQVRRSQ